MGYYEGIEAMRNGDLEPIVIDLFFRNYYLQFMYFNVSKILWYIIKFICRGYDWPILVQIRGLLIDENNCLRKINTVHV